MHNHLDKTCSPFIVKILSPLSHNSDKVQQQANSNNNNNQTSTGILGIDQETYSDLILLLDEQFQYEHKFNEHAREHLETFLKVVSNSNNESTHHQLLKNDSFWIFIAYHQQEGDNDHHGEHNEEKLAPETHNLDTQKRKFIPAGFLTLVWLPKLNSKIGYTYVDELFVREKFRRMHVGSLLLKEAKEWTQSLHLAGVRLLVRTENEAAQKLYERNGFDLSETLFGQWCRHSTSSNQ
ncbi:hypothetical protein FDP41_003407 [Naegleria fowleri]|uniref:N-acetyltransferase domain-containing protein n=1 Tax=Naegleria fowleri TaxID=5763 RepID=A0A6A5BVN4_NAEFO|nr:uncharacterized protein FDP41_003407 [Naegleria fowleri]KAF0977415.1 hypothetical protein FDP41_003407 [Naegleria fowleri]